MDDQSLFRFKPGYATRCSDAGARLERVGRLRQGRRDVQQQRPLPQVRRRHHVPLVPRDAGRGAPHARPRQHAAPGPVRAARRSSDAQVKEALDLCVSCKGCKRECPTGVDMARMKIEFLAHYKTSARLHAARPRDRLPAALRALGRCACPALEPRFLAPQGRAGLLDETRSAELAQRRFHGAAPRAPDANVVLLVDTFNRYFEPENARAAMKVLQAAGYRVHAPRRPVLRPDVPFGRHGGRSEARGRERMQAALAPYVERGIPIVGLEPSCLLLAARRIPAPWDSASWPAAPCCSRSSSLATLASSS